MDLDALNWISQADPTARFAPTGTTRELMRVMRF
jgi:hypothetical protein